MHILLEFKVILRKRFHYLFDSNSNGVFLAASYLDPSFRDMMFIENIDERDANRDRAKKFIASVASRLVRIDKEKDEERTVIQSTSQSTNVAAPSTSTMSTGSISSSASSSSALSASSASSSSFIRLRLLHMFQEGIK